MMRFNSSRPVFLATVFAVIVVSGLVTRDAQATPLSDLLFNGATITVDNLLFANWQLEYDHSSVAVDYASVDVTPVATRRLRFDALGGDLTVSGGNFLDFGFGFDVTALQPPLISDASLTLSGFTFGANSDGLITIQDSVFGSNLAILGNLSVSADAIFGNSLTDAIEFAPQSAVFQEINIFVDSGFSGANAGITSFEVEKSPEPASLLLLAIGLAGLSVVGRRAKRKG